MCFWYPVLSIFSEMLCIDRSSGGKPSRNRKMILNENGKRAYGKKILTLILSKSSFYDVPIYHFECDRFEAYPLEPRLIQSRSTSTLRSEK